MNNFRDIRDEEEDKEVKVTLKIEFECSYTGNVDEKEMKQILATYLGGCIVSSVYQYPDGINSKNIGEVLATVDNTMNESMVSMDIDYSNKEYLISVSNMEIVDISGG